MAAPLDIAHLRSLVAIAETGGFARAAATLHLSQSTVSQHVRLLERRLARPVVERAGRRTRFTPAGEQILTEARRILAVHDDALERLEAASGSSLIIGSTETAAEQVLPHLLSGLRSVFAERAVRFHIDRSTHMVDGISRGTIDIAVMLGFPGEFPGEQVGSLDLGWYAAPSIAPAHARALPLVAYVEPCGMRQLALARMGQAGHAVEVVAESTSIEGVLAAARAGLGVAVLPSAGASPHGLTRRTDLPDLGQIGVYLTARSGVEPEIEATASAALSGFFAADRSIGFADGEISENVPHVGVTSAPGIA